MFCNDALACHLSIPEFEWRLSQGYSTPLADQFEFTLHTLAAHGMRDPVYEVWGPRNVKGMNNQRVACSAKVSIFANFLFS